jgi:SEC-C motif
VSKKDRPSRKRGKREAIKLDETVRVGTMRIERFGRFVSLVNDATPEQHAEFLRRMSEQHGQIVSELSAELSRLQLSLQKYDPIEVMHRAAYELLPLFTKYYSENQFESDEVYALPGVEYLQYLISRTPANRDSKTVMEEPDWVKLWEQIVKVLQLTQSYLFSRPTVNTPPTEVDELRFIVDSRRFGIRVRRYAIYFIDHLRDALTPFESAIRDAYGVDVTQLIDGLEAVKAYQRTGIFERYGDLFRAHEAFLEKLAERGYSPDQITSGELEMKEILQSPQFDEVYRDAQERARLALTPAVFDITDIAPLPKAVLTLLSVRPGESILTSLTGPDHDDLSPLSTSVLHYKPFVEQDDRVYYFYHTGLEDRVTELVEQDIFRQFPEREPSLRRQRDDHLEAVATSLLDGILKPDHSYRNLYYPNPDRPGTLTELDALICVDDILLIVEIKAGALSAAANRGAPVSLFDELAETIGIGQRQSERAEKYIRSADEVAFFDESGKREICRIRRDKLRQIFRVVVTREDLGWVGARVAILSVVEPTLSVSLPWHISLDDLRAVAELFHDSELRFAHYLEQRLRASGEVRLSQNDEIEHVGLYNKMNFYHELPVEGSVRLTFDPSYMRDIDKYFSDKYRGESPALPMQTRPTRLAALLVSLRETRLPGRFAAASIILNMDDDSRNELSRGIEHMDAGVEAGRERSVRMAFIAPGYGISVTYTRDHLWDQELLRSAVQMLQGQCTKWVVIQLAYATGNAARIEIITPGRFSEAELAPGYEYLEERVKQRVTSEKVGRNEQCPCGSGRKYKKCHGRA